MGERRRYRYDDRDDRRRNRSETPVALIVSLAVGIPAALAALFVIVILVNREPDFEPQPVVHNEPIFAPKPPDAPPANPMLVANALAQPAPPQGIPGKRMIDLIPLIDPGQDAVHGRWAVADNVLHCNDGSFVPRIKIPYRPPEEYDFIVTFSQPGLRNGISLVMPNPNGGSFFWALGFDDGSQFCFHSNPDKGGKIPGLIAVNTAYTTTVKVRKNSVQGLVNGKLLMELKTDYKDLTCDDWRKIPDTTNLAVACDDPTVFHYVRVIEITGRGKRTR